MKSNGLLKWLLLPLVVLVLFGLIKACSDPKSASGRSDPNDYRLTPEEMKQLGIDGDTPHDTVATLVAQTKAMREELKALLSENKNQKEENDRLRLRDNDVEQRIQQALSSERERSENESRQDLSPQQKQSLLEDLRQKLSTEFIGQSHADLPIGLGLEPGDGDQFSSDKDDLVWIEPQDATAVDASGKPLPSGSSQPAQGLSFPNTFNEPPPPGQRQLRDSADSVGHPAQTSEQKPSVKSVYTLPENSTLTGSIAMTALIGRVPVDGVVSDPYPFKVLIGPDNLTANGIDLPDVAGAVLSGTAAGDWTLSCVRGHIVSLTFVFNDGRIRTLPAAQKLTSRQGGTAGNSASGTIQGGIGWLSDPYGVPCIAGERRSNAQQYLGTKSLITAAGAGVAKLLEADQPDVSNVVAPGGTAVQAGPSALNSILSGGVKDIGEWVNKLYGQAFAAVYVQPGAQVAVHLDRQLEIDYEPEGRRVRHSAGESHVSTLD